MKYTSILLGLFMVSCSIIKLWYMDRDAVERPKKPRYKLAYRKDFKPPKNLDTTQVYSLVYEANYYNGVEFPRYDYVDSLQSINIKDKQCSLLSLKFYGDSRCLLFHTMNHSYPKIEDCYMIKEKKDIIYSGKDYYYSKDGNTIEIEMYVYGDGVFSYYKLTYELSENGDTLTQRGQDFNSVSVYIRTPIAEVFKEPVDSW